MLSLSIILLDFQSYFRCFHGDIAVIQRGAGEFNNLDVIRWMWMSITNIFVDDANLTLVEFKLSSFKLIG